MEHSEVVEQGFVVFLCGIPVFKILFDNWSFEFTVAHISILLGRHAVHNRPGVEVDLERITVLELGSIIDCNASTAGLASSLAHIAFGEIAFIEVEVRRVEGHQLRKENVINLLHIVQSIAIQKAARRSPVSVEVHIKEQPRLFMISLY